MATKGESEKRPPIFVHRDVDEFPLSLAAFRVYAHLARRYGDGKSGGAYPSYQSIGTVCFSHDSPKAKPASLRRKAMRAVRELEAAGIITVDRRTTRGGRENTTNKYHFVPLASWPRAKPTPD